MHSVACTVEIDQMLTALKQRYGTRSWLHPWLLSLAVRIARGMKPGNARVKGYAR